MFGTLQDRLIKELTLAGITDIETANAWIKSDYLPAHNNGFIAVPTLPDSAFVTTEASRLTEALCLENDRTVGRDNTISWAGICLQLPESPLRRHYVLAKVKVHAYPNATLAVLHGLRVIGRYSGDGVLLAEDKPAKPTPADKRAVLAASSVAARSLPSRRGLAAPAVTEGAERRPSLTAAHRAAKGCQSSNRKTCPA
jgi:hypothetical protein